MNGFNSTYAHLDMDISSRNSYQMIVFWMQILVILWHRKEIMGLFYRVYTSLVIRAFPLFFIQTILGNDAQIHVCINGMTISNMQTFPSFYFKSFQIIYTYSTLVFQTTEPCPVIHLANLCKNASRQSLQSYIYLNSLDPLKLFLKLHNWIRTP